MQSVKKPRRQWYIDMATKPDAKICLIREQIIEDEVTDLTFQFSFVNGTARLKVSGDSLPFGNRDFIFDENGELGATGTAMIDVKPSWLKEVQPR